MPQHFGNAVLENGGEDQGDRLYEERRSITKRQVGEERPT